MIAEIFGDPQRDAIILMTSRGVRAFAFSYLGVIFTIYFSQLGYSTITVGFVVTTASASGAVLTLVWGYLSDRYGRKHILMLLAALTIVSNLIYIFFSHLIFIVAAVIIANVGAGGSAAGLTGLSRHVPVAVSPTLSAYLMRSFSLGVPIFLGGFLQLCHDCVFYYMFRDVKPPEEQRDKPQAASA